MIDPHAVVFVEHAGSIIPPRITARLAVMQPIRFDEAPADELFESVALGRRNVRTAVTRFGIPNVRIFGRDVQITAEHERLRRRPRLGEPAREALEPFELRSIE